MEKALIDEVVELQAAYNEAKSLADTLKGDLDHKRFQLLREMSEQGIKSQEDKNKRFLISRTETINVRLVNESAVLDWIANQPNLEADSYIGLKWDRFKPIARVALKQDGEKVPGTETEVTEGITIRSKEQKNG